MLGKADVFPRICGPPDTVVLRGDVLVPPCLLCSARRIDPIIVFLTPDPELVGLENPSELLRRSDVGELVAEGNGGDGGAIIVMYDSAGG